MAIEPRFHQVEKDGPVIIWKFSNPPRNLATIETMEELRPLVEEFDKDPELRVGIVTSAVPGMFIQHFDVSLIVGWAEDMYKASEEEVAQILGFSLYPMTLSEVEEVERWNCRENPEDLVLIDVDYCQATYSCRP